ncbi:MAG: nickel pincer cofactor biosynthesis protein LarC [Oscillospiraceae bacterium]|nr:nickel pincer cofactor biosynthesis protein LarC [Oscillospiraceae bacterium]
MKTLYIDCAMGAAGDMLTAALLELVEDKTGFIAHMNAILGGKAVLSAAPDAKCGVRGTHVTVSINGDEEGEELHHHHHHTSIAEIRDYIAAAPVSEKVRADALNVFNLLAEAEAAVHGRPIENVHFHEVGSIDALADVLSVCSLMELLSPEQVLASPVNVGGGTVKCAHGVLPVPAPATERLLRGIPTYSGQVKSELCTPTGAALLKYYVNRFEAQPPMTVSACGYGTGKKDFPVMNAVRVLLGQTEAEAETVLELACNIDDMSAEELGFAMEELLAAGALDVWTAPIGMKKNRPGTLLTVLCHKEKRDGLLRALFQHTATIGVRERRCARYTLARSFYTAASAYGDVRMKGVSGWGITREKPEYEDLARLARENGVTLREVKNSIK